MMGTHPRLKALRLATLLPVLLLASCATLPSEAANAPANARVERDAKQGSAEAVTAASPAPRLSLGRAYSDEDTYPREMRSPSLFAKPAPEKFHRTGLVLSIGATVGEVRGDLDGNTAVVDNVAAPTEFIYLPDIEASPGYVIAIGHRWDQYELSFGYGETDYDATFGAVQMDTLIKTMDLNIKQFYRIDSRLQPYLIAGVGWARGRIENGAQEGLTIQDARLKGGINFNFGVGASYFATEWLSFFAQSIIRLGRYSGASGTSGATLVSGAVDSDAWEISGGVKFNLMREREQ